jgi:hypothetical protein
LAQRALIVRAVIVLAAFLPPVLMLTYGIAKGRDS